MFHANTKALAQFAFWHSVKLEEAFIAKAKNADAEVMTLTAVLNALEAAAPNKIFFEEDIETLADAM